MYGFEFFGGVFSCILEDNLWSSWMLWQEFGDIVCLATVQILAIAHEFEG